MVVGKPNGTCMVCWANHPRRLLQHVSSPSMLGGDAQPLGGISSACRPKRMRTSLMFPNCSLNVASSSRNFLFSSPNSSTRSLSSMTTDVADAIVLLSDVVVVMEAQSVKVSLSLSASGATDVTAATVSFVVSARGAAGNCDVLVCPLMFSAGVGGPCSFK